jgi:type III restriction enzyme
MELKDYQERALGKLRDFLDGAKWRGAERAYADAVADGGAGAYARGPYAPVEGLETVPYCCIRLPTGGGKTLLAAHAIGIARDYLEKEFVPVIWLVPSNAILTQTLDALKQPRHPYRQAIEAAFGGAVAVFSIDERRQIRATDFRDKTVVILATHQSFNVESRDDRNVYKTDENLEDHFRDATLGEGLDAEQDGPRKGQIALSFANVLFRNRPLMILDEAHNFMTGLSGAIKARLNPGAIIEFTATPKPRSNVIAAATASELKAANMIKMPIHLSQHLSGDQAIAHAVQQRASLAKIAKASGEVIRPIALYQAQAATENAVWTVDALKAHLMASERVPEDAIVIATGNDRGLDGIDLFDPACKIEHVITIQALKEGWDCSFAYVICSLASIRAAGAVEQLLGRVLRMPFATRRASEELNRAYAHVSETSFALAAAGLKDRLTEMGFDEQSAREAIIETPPELPVTGGGPGPLYSVPQPPVYRLEERPNLGNFSPEAQAAVRMVDDGAGGVTLAVSRDAPEDVQREVARLIEPVSPGAVELVERWIVQATAAVSPAERGVPFNVPRLHLMIDGEPELAFPETFIDLAGWDLLSHPATLPGFVANETPTGYAFDIEGDHIVYEQLQDAIELALDDRTAWDAAALSRFLERETHQIHTGQEVYLEYCLRVSTHLLTDRGYKLAALVRGRFALKRAVIERVKTLRSETALRGVQMMLDGLGEAIIPANDAFTFHPHSYYPAHFYEGGFGMPLFRPQKHYYARIASFDNREELEAAMAIDALPSVKHWVRNIVGGPNSYSIPYSGGNFYPDFVAELVDGRRFVIEHKGRMDDNDKEKDNVGRRFAEKSGGRLLFLMTFKSDAVGRNLNDQLREAMA